MDKIAVKKSEKYNKLIDSAFELFEKREPTLVSIDEIVKSAGVAKGTFYLYFHDKYDLISKLILEKAVKYINSLNIEAKEINTEAELGDMLKDYINYLCNFLEQNRTLTFLVDKEVNVCVNAIIESTDSLFHKLYKEIKGYSLKCGIDEKDFTVRFYLYVDLIVSSCCNAILREHPYSLSEVKNNLYQIILSGIVQKGQMYD